MDIMQAALEMRKALQMFVGTLDVETQFDKMLEIPSVFPAYEVGKAYKTKDVFSYGTNAVGDPQLYQVLQDHTSAKKKVIKTLVNVGGVGKEANAKVNA